MPSLPLLQRSNTIIALLTTRTSLLCCLIFLRLSTFGSPQQSSPEEEFFRNMIEGNLRLEKWSSPDEQPLIHRLGISYSDAPNKLIIGFDVDPDVQMKIRLGEVQYSLSVERLDEDFSKLAVSIVGARQHKSFYFKQGKFITPVWYHTRHWKRIESKHFSFWVSNPDQFHPEAIAALERFFDESALLLGFTASQRKTIGKNKIIYVLCSDEEEIERLTTFKTRGIYLMSHDYVVTTYSCHFHEVLHLLINFRLRSAPLFTHPILQEGFASGFGGRGGIAVNSLLQSGVFLHNAQLLRYQELFRAEQMLQNDASLTYPISGLYVRFLIRAMGVKKFLSLYMKYSTTSNGLKNLTIEQTDLPSEKLWDRFVDSVKDHRDIVFADPSGRPTTVLADSGTVIQSQGGFYRIKMRKTFALRPEKPIGTFTSKRFTEAMPLQNYGGERYLFVADTNEVTVYDLYLNMSVASFSSGFTIPLQKPRWENGWCEFWVRKTAFAVPLNRMRIVMFGT
jgi:hypothetical protein